VDENKIPHVTFAQLLHVGDFKFYFLLHVTGHVSTFCGACQLIYILLKRIQLLMELHRRPIGWPHMGSQCVTCHPTHPCLNPSETGQYSICLPWGI